MPGKSGPRVRERAVRMVHDRRALDGGPRSESIRAVAPPGRRRCGALRIWCNHYGPTGPFAGLAESLDRGEPSTQARAEAGCSNETLDVLHKAERIHRYRV